jgi:hypothetical protein
LHNQLQLAISQDFLTKFSQEVFTNSLLSTITYLLLSMGTVSKFFLLLAVLLAFSSLIKVEPTFAQIQLPSFPTPTPTPITEHVTFNSGLIVYSPLEKVYSSYTVFCNASLQVPYGYQSQIIYTVDGVEQDSSNFNLNFGGKGKYHLDGAFMLPPLQNGPHQLTFYIKIQIFNYSGPPPSSDYKAGVTSYGVKYYEASYENNVNFTINSTEHYPTPTSTVPEFPSIAILPLLFLMLSIAIIKLFRKHK